MTQDWRKIETILVEYLRREQGIEISGTSDIFAVVYRNFGQLEAEAEINLTALAKEIADAR